MRTELLEEFKNDLARETQKDNTIYVGDKEPTTYAHSIKLIADKFNLVVIKARGMKILKAVDISQLALRDFLQGEYVLFPNIYTVDKESERIPGRIDRVSVIEIFIMKRGGDADGSRDGYGEDSE